MADPGATLRILNKRALTKVGPCEDNGTTRLKGLANNQVGPAEIKKFSMMNNFGSKWINKEIDAAVLDVIFTSTVRRSNSGYLYSTEMHRRK